MSWEVEAMHGPYPIRLGTSGSVPAPMRRGDGVLGSSMRRVGVQLRGTWLTGALRAVAADESGLSHSEPGARR